MSWLDALEGAMENEKQLQGKTSDATGEPTQVTKDQASFANALAGALAEPEPEPAIPAEPEDLGLIATWSFSTLKNYESCPLMVKYAKVDKIPQPESEAANRGSAIHDECELFVRGQVDEIKGDKKTKLQSFADDFDELRRLFAEGKVQCEENWGIRFDWSPCEWSDDELWGRGKLDAFVTETDTCCRIIDYKTGRKFGNELKHGDQGLSYALHAMHRYPDLDVFTVEFWYLDQGEKMVRQFKRKQLALLLARYHKRAVQMTTEVKFAPKSNPNSCRFCSYGCNRSKAGVQYGNGHCTHDYYRAGA
ncbi:PD-(D/E)XK nuclease family protein [Vibrio astriarenae]